MIMKMQPFLPHEKVPDVPCVYALVNTLTSDCYIGSTKSFKNRKSEHVKIARGKYHDSRLVQENWDTHTESCFLFVLLQVEPDLEGRLDLEQWYIDNTNSTLNICRDSRSVVGRCYTDETRQKMSVAQTGRKASEETLVKLRYAQQNRSQETNDKIAAAHRGMKRSEEAKRKMSLARMGLKQNEGTISKRVFANKKPLDQFTLDGVYVKTWLSAKDASIAFGCTDVSISQCARGISSKSQGFLWKFSARDKNEIT